MPNAYSAWTRRWLVTSHRRQAALDDVLDQLDTAIRAELDTLAPALVRAWRTTPPVKRSAQVDTLIRRRIDRILQALAVAMSTGRDLDRKALADSIPAALVPDLLGWLSSPQPVTEAVILTNDLDVVTPGTSTWVTTPLTLEQARERIAQMVLPPLDAQTLINTWRNQPRQTTAAPLIDRLSSRLWTPTAKLQIESQLTAGLAAGENVEQLTKRIRSATSTLAWQARRVARTEGRRALERDHLDRTIDALGDMVQGIMIQAVMDDRTRPEHAARHGKIYYRQSDGSYRDRNGRPAPELPDAPNCRCTYVPVLKEPEFQADISRQAYETATGNLVPDLPTYQEVWDKADIKTRRRMIGAKRYDMILDKFVGVDPWLAIDEDGSLRSINKIKHETPGDAYDRRAVVLTGRYYHQSTITSHTTPQDQPPQSALSVGIAQRVLARTDLPVNLTPEQARDYIAARVPAVQQGAEQLSPQKTVQAIQQVITAWAQAAAYSPQVSHDVLRDIIWRMIRRPEPARPMTYTTRQTMSDDMRQRLDAAIEWVRWLVPDRDLPTFRIYLLYGRNCYNPERDEMSLSPEVSMHIIVHELLHRVDYLYSGGRFGKLYARAMLSQKTRTIDGEVFHFRKDGSPGLDHYQQKDYGYGDYGAQEFITTMGEQLIANPTLAAFGDPKGLEIWIRSMRKLR
jgi:SPP1 gp7 family putative phage head morphogenesis protein